MKSLEGQTALVTGASRGIGQGIALALAKAGANVALADISIDSLSETKALVENEGVIAVAYKVNVTEYETVREAVLQIVDKFGKLDIAVNNAGILGVHKVVDMTAGDWDKIMGVNAKGVFLCCKAELEAMLPNNYGRIINTSSIAGKTGMADISAYSASKFAVIGFTNSLAKEIAQTGITVNAVCPGVVGTGMWRGEEGLSKRWAKQGETEEQSWQRQQETLLPQGEAQTPEDIGNLVVYLAGASHVTGQAIAVDGGFSL